MRLSAAGVCGAAAGPFLARGDFRGGARAGGLRENIGFLQGFRERDEPPLVSGARVLKLGRGRPAARRIDPAFWRWARLVAHFLPDAGIPPVVLRLDLHELAAHSPRGGRAWPSGLSDRPKLLAREALEGPSQEGRD